MARETASKIGGKDWTLATFVVALYCSLGGISFGFDYGSWSGILGMQTFIKDFGVCDPTTGTCTLPASWQSAGSGPPMAGLAFGALLSGFIGNRFGRIRTFQMASCISIVGIVIQSTAMTSYWQVVAGRVVNSAALGTIANAIPTYLAEIAPLAIRGLLVNCYQFSISVGAVLVYTTNWGMHNRTDQWAYRLVFIMQLIIPVIFVTGSLFIPESPRWLIGKGRDAEAKKVLGILRTGTPQELIEHEVQLLSAAEEENRTQFKTSWMECFKGTNLRRTLIVVGVQCLQQAQGNSFMASYMVIYFEMLGVQDVYKISILFVLTMAISCAFAFYFPDRFGRRWIMIGAALVLGTCMFIVSGIAGSSLSQDKNAIKGLMGALFIWQFTMSLGWSSCVWIVTAETPSLQLREKSIMTATFSGSCVSILITFVSPFIQSSEYGGLGARIGFIYGGFSFATAMWALFFLPETGSRNLEELDELFQKKVSVWKFSKYQTSGYGAQLAEIEIEGHSGDPGQEKHMSVDVAQVK